MTAQYIGGPGNSHAMAVIVNQNPVPLNAYRGGVGDGSASDATANQHPAPLNAYRGGTGDGSASDATVNQHPAPLNAYRGGTGDGSASDVTANQHPPPLNAYRGGTGDGSASDATANQHPAPLNAYRGGTGDGSASDATANQHPAPLNAYRGGTGDGSASDATANQHPAPLSAYRGGTGDGSDVTRINDLYASPKVFLEGPFVLATSLMNDQLRSANVIPKSEPYTTLGNYTHVGPYSLGEGVNPATLAVSGNDAIVDWVFVQLRSNTSPSTIVRTKMGLVQRDGDVVDTDGTSPLRFQNMHIGGYHLAIRHRNHLGIMTAAPLTLSNTVTPIDFTASTTATWGTNARRSLSGGVMVMWGGDVNWDGILTYNGGAVPGRSDLFNRIVGHSSNVFGSPTFTFQAYATYDMDMDGVVSYNGGSSPGRSWLFNRIVAHPGNLFGSPTFTFMQQLP